MNRFVRSLAAAAALFAASLLPAHAELDVISLKTAIETSIASDYPKLDALYKELHAHPELAFQEVKTAARLAAEMRAHSPTSRSSVRSSSARQRSAVHRRLGCG